MCVCVCVCVRACVRACVRVCVRACVRVLLIHSKLCIGSSSFLHSCPLEQTCNTSFSMGPMSK